MTIKQLPITVRIEYLHFNEYGGIAQYAMTVKGKSLQSIERTFYDRIGGWDAFFKEVAA
tara:strand:- start:409 stop:585 length:177 start_codon:yes stop_codon:yes gene_type:complete